MKTAISVPDETFLRVEAAARRLGISTSEFFSRAADRWLVALDDAATAQIDAVLAEGGATDADAFVLEAGRRVASNTSPR